MEKKQNKRLFLVDGTALAYRSHFAFVRRPLTNSKGRDVGALYGYTGTLFRILREEKPDFIAVAFDTPQPTFRHEKYELYKATREKTPDELIEQLPDIKTITEAMGIRQIEKPGFEADDVIGTLARQGEEEGLDVFIVTGDKDFMQIVSDRVQIYNIMRPDSDVTIQGIEAVREKFGVLPDRLVDVFGLMGDSSDNVPGVPGVGLKTAMKLIQQFGNLESVYSNLDEVPGNALRKKIADNRDLAFLSRELVVIRLDTPIDLTVDELEPQDADGEILRNKIMECDFSSYLQYLERGVEEKSDAGDRCYILVKDEKACRELLDRMKRSGSFVFDLETTSLDTQEADIVGASVAIEAKEAFYIPADRKGGLFPDGESYPIDIFLGGLAGLLADPAVQVTGQNIKYDLAVLRRAGITEIRAGIFDTMVAHYLCHPGAMQHGLDYLSLKYLGLKKIPTSDLIGKGKKQISMADVPVEKVCEYACEDADVTLRLRSIMEEELKERDLVPLFRDLEMPLLLVLEEMEHEGVRLDEKKLEKLAAEYGKRIDSLTGEIFDLAGEEFNINSTKQLGLILFEKLNVHEEVGLKRVPRTKTGYSTNAAVLESISGHPLGKLLLEYRRLQKLNSTYITALPRLVNERSGCIHTSFNQAVAATGRLSSSDPNLQNIPVRTDEGRRIREAFIPRRRGWRLLSADYSQVELRILAHISKDKSLREAFRRGEDIHRGTAALIFGLEPDAVTPEKRSQAKTINFGIIYGMGPHRLSRETGISFGEAREFIEAYFQAFPGVKEYIDSTLVLARETGYVATLLGRKRIVDDILAVNQQVRSNAENIAVNTPIQGTAADLIKKAMIEIQAALKENELEAKMILQVHDELVFDLPIEEVDRVTRLVKEKMEGALDLAVPLVVDVGLGKDWLEAH